MVSIIFKIHHMIIKKDLKPRKQRADTENFSSGFYNLILQNPLWYIRIFMCHSFSYMTRSQTVLKNRFLKSYMTYLFVIFRIFSILFRMNSRIYPQCYLKVLRES